MQHDSKEKKEARKRRFEREKQHYVQISSDGAPAPPPFRRHMAHPDGVKTSNATDAQIKFFRRLLTSVSDVDELNEQQQMALQRLLGTSERVRDKQDFFDLYGHDHTAAGASSSSYAQKPPIYEELDGAPSSQGTGKRRAKNRKEVPSFAAFSSMVSSTTSAHNVSGVSAATSGDTAETKLSEVVTKKHPRKNRQKKVKKLLKEITELENKDPDSLTESQKTKIERKDDLQRELDELNAADH
eukprot:gb/GECG01013926.1/.p1 GENE.gb/GECG01013926.1/~~gb/GECG01013926.1/.p1  ORF type:complete len:242 (+),score=43.90 gb/GECG01013926.1/:1-726(+)